MPRGGYREGAGGKPKWKHGKTKVIRVPEVLADLVVEYARKLDNLISEPVTTDLVVTGSSKSINLANTPIYSFDKGAGVYLADLVSRGYQIKPDVLHDSVLNKNRARQQLRANQLKDDINKEIKNLEQQNE